VEMGKKWLDSERQIIKDSYGILTYKEISNILDRSISSIENEARKLKLINSTIGMNSLSHKTKYNINHNVFCDLTNENCYMAGFIAADGNILKNRIAIGLKKDDLEHLKLIKSFFEYSGKIYEYTNSVHLEMRSNQIVEDLKNKFNITERKSLTLKPPVVLEEKFAYAFIKGYIDGDGSIYFTNNKQYKYLSISCVGTEEMCCWIKFYFDKILDSTTPKIQKNNNIFVFRVNGKQAEKVYSYLKYKIDTPTMERKWKHTTQKINCLL